MSIKLESYHPLSHLGELLYKDSVAQRDAKIARDTEEARQRSATDAQARLQQMKAVDPALRMRGLRRPSTVAAGTPLAEVFAESETTEPAGSGLSEMLRSTAETLDVDPDVYEASLLGLPGAEEYIKGQIGTRFGAEREAQKADIGTVQKATQDILTAAKDARRSQLEIDQALNLLDKTGTGMFSLDGLSALPVSSPILQTALAQLRSPEGERLRRFLGNRFKDIRESAFGGRIFAAEVPAALDAVPGITDRPEVIRAALKAIQLGVDYAVLQSELVQELKAQERAGELQDARGRPRRITTDDLLELDALAIEMLELDAEDEIAEVNQILGQ